MVEFVYSDSVYSDSVYNYCIQRQWFHNENTKDYELTVYCNMLFVAAIPQYGHQGSYLSYCWLQCPSAARSTAVLQKRTLGLSSRMSTATNQ